MHHSLTCSGPKTSEAAKASKRKQAHRAADVATLPMPAATMAPNIYETVEARRARLGQGHHGTATTASSGGTGSAGGSPSATARKPGPLTNALGLTHPAATNAATVADVSSPYTDSTPGSASTATASQRSPAKQKRNPNRESLSDYGFESQEFSVFGELLKRR
jgi:hypothetical protein